MLTSEEINNIVSENSAALYAHLRSMISYASYDGSEGGAAKYILNIMKEYNFDDAYIDDFGNVIGRVGKGKHIIAFDAHIDVVGAGDINNWTFDPFQGKEDSEKIYGRGSSDQKGGMACMLIVGKMLKEFGVPDDMSVYFVGSVMEEDYEGTNWTYIIEGSASHPPIKPDLVISTEPSSLRICTGHRGRCDLIVSIEGKSAHGSMPYLGENAIERMAELINEIKAFSENMIVSDPALGKGSINISGIRYSSPSKCAVPDKCEISIDRRLTNGETAQSAIEEILNLPAAKKYGAKAVVEQAAPTAWTGKKLNIKCDFPCWIRDKSELMYQTMGTAYKYITNAEPSYGTWNFSTNCVSICGKYNIPCIGIGPGIEALAHQADEYTLKSHLLQATATYFSFINMYKY